MAGLSPGVARAALVLIAAFPLAPLLSALLPGATGIERALAFWFDLHCERDPARTFVLSGVPLAVCVRCTGIYLGLGAGALVARPRLSAGHLRWSVTAAALLMLGDVLLERYGWQAPSALRRVLTGLLLAYPVGAALVTRLGRVTPRVDGHNP